MIRKASVPDIDLMKIYKLYCQDCGCMHEVVSATRVIDMYCPICDSLDPMVLLGEREVL